MSVMNGLQIPDHDEELELTELEGNLIAKNIVFMKIFHLPKSRWTGLKDRIVNVPIKDDTIMNTVTKLPRTPAEAGLIEVNLKRKLEYKNSHVKQLIDPKKCFRMLELLKKSGNIHYQFYDDLNMYSKRCREEDAQGYTLIFEEETELMQDLTDIELEELSEEERLEMEYIEKDPVRRFQFEGYNKSICMANMYPEMDPENSVTIAPGEDQIPKCILYDHDWDIKAYPHLNSPDGKYGLHHNRSKRLTDQHYFMQRICNRKTKFARNPSYVYAAVAYLEQKQIQRNINISYSRGKEVIDSEGRKSLKMENAYSVLDKIKQTPSYWREGKYEMYAKLDNFGPFIVFFTLSSGEVRWDENFAAILRERNYNVRYIIENDRDDYPKTSVYVDFEKDGEEKTKKIQDFIKEELDESLHECIRGNVLIATRYFNHKVKSFMKNIALGNGNPMNVDRYCYKTEFQSRGAAHVHGTMWVKLHKIEKIRRSKDRKTPKDKNTANSVPQVESQPFLGIRAAFLKLRNGKTLDEDEEYALRNFIDEFTTVSLCEDEVGIEVASIAKEVNKHHHTKTCLKYSDHCRFNYPKYPIWFTIIAKPYDSTEFEEEMENMHHYTQILTRVKEVLEDEDVMKGIMDGYSKDQESKEEYEINRKKRILEMLEIAGVSKEDYIEALSNNYTNYSYHQKRDIDEIYINSYNPEWLRSWNANIDVQICMDYFQIIAYITEYFLKDEDPETEEAIKEVLKQNPDAPLKEKMKKVASVFLSHRQIGEAEGFYKLLPDLLLRNSNATCQWLFVGQKEDKYKRMKKVDESEEKNPNLVKLDGVEGMWYEQADFLSKYKRRPDKLEHVCYAQFGKMYRTGGSSKYEEQEPENSEYDSNEEEEFDDDNDPESKFHYIMDENEGYRQELPKVIKLKDPYLKENPFMQKRLRPVAIRFHKPNRNTNPHKYFLSELMLYIPFRNEEIEFRPDDPEYLENVYIDNMERLLNIKGKVMEYLESVEEARYFVEEASKNLNLDGIGAQLDAAKEQEEFECEEELAFDLHPDYLHLNTDNLEKKDREEKKETHVYSKIKLPHINILKKKTREMDQYQREVINIVIKYVKDIRKAEHEGNSKPDPIFYMVHGNAGTGKSHVIRTVAEWVQLILQRPGDNLECPYVLKTAFTGTAASLIEGMTLHSAFGLEFGNNYYTLSDKIRDAKKQQLSKLEMILLDEISMVKSDLIYQLDLRLQEIKGKPRVPFGGVSILCFGDILQLCPVMGKFAFEEPKNPSFKVTYYLDSRWEKMKVINLEKNHRQGKSREYADMLNRIRVGEHTSEDLETLRKRIRPSGHQDLQSVSLDIVCTKKLCSKINTSYLARLEGEEILIEARNFISTRKKYTPRICKKEGTVGNTPLMNKLCLKVGCKVMLTYNVDTCDGLTNGQLGTLLATIRSDDGNVSKLIVEFQKIIVGDENRKKHPIIAARYPKGTVIEKVSLTYKLSGRSNSRVGSPTVIQFPIKVAQAITSHKIQGQSIPKPLKVALDLSSVFEKNQAYVMLSRVEELEQIYILNEIKEEKIKPAPKALEELLKMNQRSVNSNPIPWKQREGNYVNIAHLNCMNLMNTFEEIKCDFTLLESSIICLSETWLEDSKNCPELTGYKNCSNCVGPGKGITIYYDENTFQPIDHITDEQMQISKMRSLNPWIQLDLITVYRSSNGDQTALLNHLKNLITPNRTTIIHGDFNICYRETKSNTVTKYLEENSFNQLVNEATHIKGRVIDHCYIRKEIAENITTTLYRYSPYYSDHDALCTTLKFEV